NGRGVWTNLVIRDVDGELRGNPPDIGADEYEWQVAASAVHDLAILHTDGTIVLTWSRATGAARYHVYSGILPGFAISQENRVGTVTDTTFIDTFLPGVSLLRFYVVTSDDEPNAIQTHPGHGEANEQHLLK
ncbi:hypothetical protein KJ815_08150, partial [bacterium]|nr:hypothetical protein [bacterium]